jgi:hypothetical protein
VEIKAMTAAGALSIVLLVKLEAPLVVAIFVTVLVLGVLAIATNIEVEWIEESQDGRRRRRLVVTRRKRRR